MKLNHNMSSQVTGKESVVCSVKKVPSYSSGKNELYTSWI